MRNFWGTKFGGPKSELGSPIIYYFPLFLKKFIVNSPWVNLSVASFEWNRSLLGENYSEALIFCYWFLGKMLQFIGEEACNCKSCKLILLYLGFEIQWSRCNRMILLSTIKFCIDSKKFDLPLFNKRNIKKASFPGI